MVAFAGPRDRMGIRREQPGADDADAGAVGTFLASLDYHQYRRTTTPFDRVVRWLGQASGCTRDRESQK